MKYNNKKIKLLLRFLKEHKLYKIFVNNIIEYNKFFYIENLCKAKVINGKHMIQKITLEDDGVRKQLNLSDDVSVPMYYKAAYKINDHFKNMRKDGIEGVG